MHKPGFSIWKSERKHMGQKTFRWRQREDRWSRVPGPGAAETACRGEGGVQGVAGLGWEIGELCERGKGAPTERLAVPR